VWWGVGDRCIRLETRWGHHRTLQRDLCREQKTTAGHDHDLRSSRHNAVKYGIPIRGRCHRLRASD